ncbi:hypothetical protein [Caulobacter sp. DWR1-3-2b1]|uniref:hypothetical protein n=1 Tax=Caulobacter sp. DWR1-3-2b1 TaxID=2804670 RepID=UPI003CF25600
MPHPRPARPICTRACRSNRRRDRDRAWLDARLLAKIGGLAGLLERKRVQDDADETAGPPFRDRPSGPASREDPCDETANTPSMPR